MGGIFIRRRGHDDRLLIMAKFVLADTGFWYALYEPRDNNFDQANTIGELIQEQNIILPWPSLYETLSTRFTKRPDRMKQFKTIISKPNVNFIDDTEYKDNALNLTFDYSRIGSRTFSLVDVIIRELLKDDSLKIDYQITFNKRDFIDLCQIRKIDIYD